METIKNATKKIENVSYSITLTEHSKTRASQRGINEEVIQLALCYGKEIFKQGLVFIAVQSKTLPETISGKLRKKLNNLVLVLAGDSDSIITCYKNNHSIKYINRKINYLA